MRIWERKGCTIVENEIDVDLHEFDIVGVGNEVIATITPVSVEDMQHIASKLDSGADIGIWEDKCRNALRIH